jgi:hypothetical protein
MLFAHQVNGWTGGALESSLPFSQAAATTSSSRFASLA